MLTLLAAAAAYALMGAAFLGARYATRHPHDYATPNRRCAICGMDDKDQP